MTEDERKLLVEFIDNCNNQEDFIGGLEAMIDDEGNTYKKAIGYFEAGLLANEMYYPHFAVAALEKALQLFETMEFHREVFACYMNIADSFYSLPAYQEAIADYQKAWEYLQTHYGADWSDSLEYLQYAVHLNMGRPYVDLGQLETGIICYENALLNAEKSDYKIGMAESYIALGNAYRNQGDLQAAMQHYRQVLTIDLAENAFEHLGKTYEGLGNISTDLDRSEEAVDYYQKALEYYQQLGDKRLIAMCMVNIGSAYEDMAIVHLDKKAQSFKGESLVYLREALTHYQEAKKVAGQEDAYVLMHVFNRMATISQNVASIEVAKTLHAKVLEYAEIAQDYYFIHHTYTSLGWIHFQEQNLDTSLQYHQKALQLSIDCQDKRGEAIHHVYVGRVLKEKNQLKEAISFYEKGIKLSEQIGASLLAERDKIGYYGYQVDTYQDMILLQLETNHLSTAYEYLERSKSKAFRDLLEKVQKRQQIKSDYRGSVLSFKKVKGILR